MSVLSVAPISYEISITKKELPLNIFQGNFPIAIKREVSIRIYNFKLAEIFKKAVNPYESTSNKISESIKILSCDDLILPTSDDYNYYEYNEYIEHENAEIYNEIYRAKISKMNAENIISDANESLKDKCNNENYKHKRKTR